MYKKISISIVFVLSIFTLYANDETVKNQYEKSPDNFFAEGKITINDEVYPLVHYMEKSDDSYNFSMVINEKLIQSRTKEDSVLFNEDSESILADTAFLTSDLPMEIFNYPLLNRDYTIIEKPVIFTYKNLKSSKILITDKVVDPKVETSGPEPDIEIEREPAPENKYKKIIYIISQESNIILRKEYYRERTSRNPEYIYEVESIKFINGNYIADSWKLMDSDSENSVKVDYNPASVVFSKNTMPNKYEKITQFYGVR